MQLLDIEKPRDYCPLDPHRQSHMAAHHALYSEPESSKPEARDLQLPRRQTRGNPVGVGQARWLRGALSCLEKCLRLSLTQLAGLRLWWLFMELMRSSVTVWSHF